MGRRKKSQPKRVMIAVLGIVLVLGFVWFFSNFDFSIVQTSVMSTARAEVAKFDPQVYEALGFLYASLENEYVGCLQGRIDSQGNILVQEFEETTIVETNTDSLTFKPCDKSNDYLGTIHSHPDNNRHGLVPSCRQSTTDAFTFGQSEDRIACVQCGADEIRCYTRNDVSIGVPGVKQE